MVKLEDLQTGAQVRGQTARMQVAGCGRVRVLGRVAPVATVGPIETPECDIPIIALAYPFALANCCWLR